MAERNVMNGSSGKPTNMLVDRRDSRWHVTGLFDLMKAHFGNGESDLSRKYCFYVGVGRADLANLFVATYSNLLGDPVGLPTRFTPFVIHDRAFVWEWRQRHPGIPEPVRHANFQAYVSSFFEHFGR